MPKLRGSKLTKERLTDYGKRRGRNARCRVEGSIDAHFKDPAHRNTSGRQRLKAEVRKVNTALHQLLLIDRNWVEDESLSKDLRDDCRKLLKRVERGGNGGEFAKVMVEASKLHGRRLGEARKQATRRLYGEITECDLGNGVVLRSVNSPKALSAIGRDNNNCLRSNSYGHHTRLKNGSSNFFEIRCPQRSLLVIEVRVDSGEVLEAEDPDKDVDVLAEQVGGRKKLQRLLLDVCREIRCRGDDNELFAGAGAYSEFVDRSLDDRKPSHAWSDGRKKYKAWAHDHVIIIRCRGQKGVARWSRFTFDGKRWLADDLSALDEGCLAAIFLCNSDLLEVVRKACLPMTRHTT